MSKSAMYRMVSLQIMNLVNVSLDNELYIGDIKTMGMAVINASQLFLTDKEISSLRVELYNRLKVTVSS
ncbi:hypothetical protein pW2_146 [Bacillus phage pW2]|uniref:Uncharacterized protein n=1 Tax=Bacillus phage pW2 TaxID=2500559 RepID=A0A3T0IHT3_9CAUD|nr:hypothetical protein PQE69_gp144 [Bacillus phage pW2]AZU98974.1 hypothetical protein pW2_146 [Bacillus phage pW2]